MNIEEAIKYIKNDIEIDKDTASWFENGNMTKEQIEESIDAYETLLTAYEKEKEKNKELNWKYTASWVDEHFISKDKLKEIVDECIPKKENIITRELEYTPNANANSYLTQEILSLLKEE